MVLVKKIREGVLLISWTSNNPTFYGQTEENVNIDEISRSFRLSLRKLEPVDYVSILEMEINPIPSTTEKNLQVLKPVTVLAIKNGLQQPMLFQNSLWTTTFPENCQCGSNQYASTSYNILIDFNLTCTKPETKHILDHLLNLWETKTQADVTFKFKEKDIQAHSLIIASGSPVLAAMFQHNFKEKQEKIVEINDIKSNEFEKMLKFIYTGDTDLDNADVADLLIVANKYAVDPLKRNCLLFMRQNLTVNNVIHYLVLSHLHEAPNLYKAALHFLSQNAVAIVSRQDWVDLMKDYLELGLEAVQCMVACLSTTNQ